MNVPVSTAEDADCTPSALHIETIALPQYDSYDMRTTVSHPANMLDLASQFDAEEMACRWVYKPSALY